MGAVSSLDVRFLFFGTDRFESCCFCGHIVEIYLLCDPGSVCFGLGGLIHL